jgi:hypothetical protein
VEFSLQVSAIIPTKPFLIPDKLDHAIDPRPFIVLRRHDFVPAILQGVDYYRLRIKIFQGVAIETYATGYQA